IAGEVRQPVYALLRPVPQRPPVVACAAGEDRRAAAFAGRRAEVEAHDAEVDGDPGVERLDAAGIRSAIRHRLHTLPEGLCHGRYRISDLRGEHDGTPVARPHTTERGEEVLARPQEGLATPVEY